MAARDVRAFLDKGLDSTATPMIERLLDRGIDSAAVLEVGAGSGTALVTMLEGGADTAVGVEISPSYEEAATELFAARGHAGKVEWRTGDFVDMSNELPPFDVVFLNRVVCCYPFMTEMVDAATGRTRRYLGMSYPRKRWPIKLGTKVLNLWMRLHRNSFRTFVHDPRSIAETAEAAGLRLVDSGTTFLWHWGVWERADVA